MIALSLAIVFLTGSVGLMIAAIVNNQIDPNLSTALGIPLANIVSSILALVGAVIAAVAHNRNTASPLTRRTMIFGFVLVVALVLLFPLSDRGHFSSFS